VIPDLKFFHKLFKQIKLFSLIMDRIIRDVKKIIRIAKKAYIDIEKNKISKAKRLLNVIKKIDLDELSRLNPGSELVEACKKVFAEADAALINLDQNNYEKAKQMLNGILAIENNELKEEEAGLEYAKSSIIYGRIVTKREEKMTKKTRRLQAAEKGEMVPAFEAENVINLKIKKDKLKAVHKLLGGSGAGDRIIFFKPHKPPVVSKIPLRKSDQIRDIIGASLQESKFKSGIRIELF